MVKMLSTGCCCPTLRCYTSCLASCCLVLVIGMIISYPSPTFPQINHGHFGFKLNAEMMSWLASFAGLFAIPGSVILVPVMDRYGRKFALLACTVPTAIGWLLTVLTYNVITLAISRAILGCVIGMVYSCIPIYLAEIAPKEIRGVVGSCLAISAYVGALLTNILGSFLSWKWVAVVCLGFTAACSLFSFIMYETPRWLVSRGYKDAAAEVLSKTRGIEDEAMARKEVDEIEKVLKSVAPLSFFQGMLALVKPPLWKPFLIIQLLMVFQQFTGTAFIQNYTVTIFHQATSGLNTTNVLLKNPFYQASVAISVFVLGSVISAFVVDRLGRRPLLIASGLGLTVALTGLGTYYYLQTFNPAYAGSKLFWLPLASLMLYDFGFGVAYGGIPFLILSEIFPLHVRAVANGLGALNHNICFFVVVKVFPTLHSVPNYGMFWIYAGVALSSVVFIYFFIPETKGKSLEEIQKQWYSVKNPINNNNEVTSERL